jgi:pimeloyl-ACP methyl ester carboxylesterase
MMFDFASRWIFPVHAVPPSGPLPEGAEKISFTGPTGKKVAGTRCRPVEQPWDGTLILGFGGNAWNAQDVATYLHEVFPAAEVISYFYRGYAPSEGEPSAAAMMEDAPASYDDATALVKPKRVIAIGFSIGSGVAATLSARRKLDGLILVTPFDSLKAVAQSFVPWLPIGMFFDHEIATAEAVEESGVPTAIFAADRDEIVSRERTEALRKRVPNLVYDKTLERTGHNSIYARSAFQLGLREAAARLIS